MNSDEFRRLLEKHLQPMFPGMSVGHPTTPNSSRKLAAYAGPGEIMVKPDSSARFRVPLTRSQTFDPEERNFIGEFVREIKETEQFTPSDYYPAVLDALPVFAIARHLGWSTSKTSLGHAIRKLESLAPQTYEGRPIVCAIGITGSVGNGIAHISDFLEKDFARVLSNGFDTMYEVGSDGKVFDITCLTNATADSFAPHRLGAIAKWTGENGRRVALVLNRNSEILVLKKGQLVFAKRRARWTFFPHYSVVKQLHQGSKVLREEVYKSCLDASFARTGACVCVVGTASGGKLPSLVKDFIHCGGSMKTDLLRKVLGKPFHKIDRRLRQEILAMDGATIIGAKGQILSAGEIIKVPAGSVGGGGREAAAKALSKVGIGIKVSADGPITGFRNGHLVFTVGGKASPAP